MRPIALLPLAAALLLGGAAQAQIAGSAPSATSGGARPAVGDVTGIADKPPEASAGKAHNRRVEVKLSKATDDEGSDTSGKASEEAPPVAFKDSVRTAREHGSR